MLTSDKKCLKPYVEKPRAQEKLRSLKKLAKLIIKSKGLEKHQKSLLHKLIWLATERDGKYKTRFRSMGVLNPEPGLKVQHEHVFTKKQQVEELLASAKNIDEVFNSAIGCMVTKEEHKELSKVGDDIEGWKRYREAGIAVFDMKPKKPKLTSKGAKPARD